MTNPTLYVLDAAGVYQRADAAIIIAEAKRRLASRFRRGAALCSPDAAKEAIQLNLLEREHEVFGCLYLDHRHRVLEFAELFRGTIDGASVYPREVVKAALGCNSAAVIFFHNHPSGEASPSEADKTLTQRLRTALALVDIRVLDHFVIGGDAVYSFAESGLL
jgi:DNA repair protein RadC